jgi:transposase
MTNNTNDHDLQKAEQRAAAAEQRVAEAKAVVADLEAKRAASVQRGTDLADERSDIAFKAHTTKDEKASKQNHVAGERMFVDYAGTTLTVIDASTGEARTAQLFVAVLGASNYTYAEATWTHGLSDWIGAHTRAFAFVGGVPTMVVSDNLCSGITKACFYEPQVNRTYAEMAAH